MTCLRSQERWHRVIGEFWPPDSEARAHCTATIGFLVSLQPLMWRGISGKGRKLWGQASFGPLGEPFLLSKSPNPQPRARGIWNRGITGLQSWDHHFLAIWSWVHHLLTLSPSFLRSGMCLLHRHPGLNLYPDKVSYAYEGKDKNDMASTKQGGQVLKSRPVPGQTLGWSSRHGQKSLAQQQGKLPSVNLFPPLLPLPYSQLKKAQGRGFHFSPNLQKDIFLNSLTS